MADLKNISDVGTNLDLGSMPLHWGKILQPLLDSPVVIPIPPQPLGVQQLIESNTYTFQAALDWMIRERFNGKHKVRGNGVLRKQTEPLGDFVYQIFRLCERCYTTAHLLASVKIPYSDQTIWFQKIILELYAIGFQGIMYRLYPTKLFLKPEESGKKQAVRQMHAICSLANNLERRDVSSELAFALLLDVAIGIAESSKGAKGFKNEFYKPFITSWREAIDVVEKYWVSGVLVSDGNRLHSNIGRGSHVRDLTQIFETELMRNEILKPLPGLGYKS